MGNKEKFMLTHFHLDILALLFWQKSVLRRTLPKKDTTSLKTIREFEEFIATSLAPVYPEAEAEAIASLVAEHILKRDRLTRSMQRDQPVPPAAPDEARQIIARLLRHEPVQYVLEQAHFYGLTLYVNPAVLIPRPETEELVSLIIRENQHRHGLRVLDIGTGSGCISLALATHLPTEQVYGLDVSSAALAVARQNAAAHQQRVEWVQADILAGGVNLPAGSLDIVVSNPPYVLEREKNFMRQNVLDHEPPLALFVPDADPLLFYRAIARQSRRLLKPSGKLYLEINEQFGNQVVAYLAEEGYAEIKLIKDLFGKDRFIHAQQMTTFKE